MALLWTSQYKTTYLSVPGGITSGQTTGIILNNIDGVDTTRPGQICVTFANPLDITKAEYINFTSINSGTKELQGVTRGSEGFSAKAHNDQAVVAFVVSAGHINELNKGVLGQQTYATDTGTANAYAVSMASVTELVAGLRVAFKATNANTGASTLTINALTTKNLYKNASAALDSGDIIANAVVTAIYDGTAFQVYNINTTNTSTTSVASSATPTPTGYSKFNELYVTALAAAAELQAPSGTPVNGNKLIVRIKDNGTARALTYNAIYRAIGITLPTTTVLSKTTYIGFLYNSADSKWDAVATITEV